MGTTFHKELQTLKDIANQFDPESRERKNVCLKALSGKALTINHMVIQYAETLLYLISYPAGPVQLSLAEKELSRITSALKAHKHRKIHLLENSGLPFTDILTRFSHDAIRWLLSHPHCSISLDSFRNPSLQLNDVLRLTLPSLEKSETTASYTNMELLDALRVPVKQRLVFLVHELSRLDSTPLVKDLLVDHLDMAVRIVPRDKRFSLAYNRLAISTVFFHQEIIKRFDIPTILDHPIPLETALTSPEKTEVIQVIKNSMSLTVRETDPITSMEENSLRLYSLERGISVAIYGIVPSRQLPLESYVGYTAFKNGFPVAYGGAWIFGERANFGINIFKPFRNGESAYIMAQLLRVYRHVFKVEYFEVEPYQFGLDNPEGIASGAFWFYYRFGFRPLDRHLLLLSKKEAEKIKTRKGYRTRAKTLLEFTHSNVGLNLGSYIPPKLTDITLKVTRMIQHSYRSERLAAETACRQKFMERTKMNPLLNEAENQVFTEVALWAEAMNIRDHNALQLMMEMIQAKPRDLFWYQDLLIRFYSLNQS